MERAPHDGAYVRFDESVRRVLNMDAMQRNRGHTLVEQVVPIGVGPGGLARKTRATPPRPQRAFIWRAVNQATCNKPPTLFETILECSRHMEELRANQERSKDDVQDALVRRTGLLVCKLVATPPCTSFCLRRRGEIRAAPQVQARLRLGGGKVQRRGEDGREVPRVLELLVYFAEGPLGVLDGCADARLHPDGPCGGRGRPDVAGVDARSLSVISLWSSLLRVASICASTRLSPLRILSSRSITRRRSSTRVRPSGPAPGCLPASPRAPARPVGAPRRGTRPPAPPYCTGSYQALSLRRLDERA